MTLRYFIFYSLLILGGFLPFSSSYAYGDDVSKESLSFRACNGLGNLCDKYQKSCARTSNIGNCMGKIYLNYEIAKERCGIKKQLQCFEENEKYWRMWMSEINIPNIDNPKREIAFKRCADAGLYRIRSEALINLNKELFEAVGMHEADPSRHTISKEYYECFQEILQ